MANKLYEESSVQAIAQAIREKNGGTSTYKVSEMAEAVRAIQTGSKTGEYSWNQIPTAVKNFLTNVTYDSNDYTTSRITEFAPATADKNNTYPIGKTIETASGVLDRKGYEIAVSNGNTTLYNDIPNQHTEYVVRNNGAVSQAGTLKPTGALRLIKCSTSNVRDLGGWACDGGTVKYGKLFRGGEFQSTDLDIFLNQLGIRHELNLRGKTEGEGSRTILRDYVGYTCTENYTWYSLANTDDWKTTIRCIFDSVASDKPVYFHCSAGADRTGTVACIIEAMLGVSQSDIDKDYELTCFASGVSDDSVARRRNEAEWSGLISQINALTVGTTFRDKVLNWVATLGFTADEINAFRSAMIDGNPDTITLDIDIFTITKTGENISFDNEATTIAEYQPYVVNIIPNAGNLIKSVTVKMGGVDITDAVFDGAFEPNGTLNVSENGEFEVSEYKKVKVNVGSDITSYTVTNILDASISNNSQTEAIHGQSYGATITPNDGGEIAHIKVTMGGTDVTSSVVTLI